MSQKSQELSMKRRAIREAIRKALQQIQDAKDRMLKLDFEDFEVVAGLCPMSLLLDTSVAPKIGRPLTDFVEVIQGVTWGGKGAEQVFDLKEEDVKKLNLEHEVTLKRIGGEDIKRWHIGWTRRYALFPYVTNKGKWSRAFELIGKDVNKPIYISDALDFKQVIDDAERRILQQDLQEDEKLKNILEHRIALGLIKYPHVATYLIQHYEQLRGRIFEGKTLQEYNKMWYEYHRPRTPIVIRKHKIVGPRLVKMARFALDSDGFLPRDSVVVMVPKQKAFKDLKSSLDKTLNRETSEEETLLYILAFLNSETFDYLLREKISKKRGGYPIVDERLLQRMGIPIPTRASKNVVEKLLKLVKEAVSQGCTDKMDEEINKLVKELYKAEEEEIKTH